MSYYRITKYNPEFRDEKGCYKAEDWTSISDIGKTYDNGILTTLKYKQIEDAYVEAVKIILKEKGISQMVICNLEKNDDVEEFIFLPEEKVFLNKMNNNCCLGLCEIEIATRLSLREVIWSSLLTDTGDFKIEFGYDYYMYIRGAKLEDATKQKILDNGLFVELLNEGNESK